MSKGIAALGTLICIALGSGSLCAQIANLPPAVRAKIVEIGPVLNPDMIRATYALFTPLLQAKPRDGVRVRMDIAYGADPKEKLDVYQPAGNGPAPIVIFVRGGGFVGADKNSNDVIYSNVAVALARQGLLGINANYRLAPAHPWPAGAEDVGRMVAWAKAHGAEYDGDPRRIVLMGHSAGAAHVAAYVLTAALQPQDGPGVAGAILVSGRYRAEPGMPANEQAYYGTDASQYAARSPISHVNEGHVPLFLALAEYDPLYLAEPTLDLARAVCARDQRCPRLAWLKGHNHISSMASFDTADQEFSNQVVDFVRSLP
ncbi:MAG TPA: alpha/beta hydrolase [bacterium]|nr:alpha/beta hydrolase [bacterium]